MQILQQVDVRKLLRNLDWKKLIDGASQGKMTQLPVTPECAIELGKIALASNQSGKSILENPVFKSKFLLDLSVSV